MSIIMNRRDAEAQRTILWTLRLSHRNGSPGVSAVPIELLSTQHSALGKEARQQAWDFCSTEEVEPGVGAAHAHLDGVCRFRERYEQVFVGAVVAHGHDEVVVVPR